MQFGKRAVFRPSPIPFLIAGHRSLFKVSNGWRIDQHWSEGRAGGGRGMAKRVLSERDICTKFITPALRQAGWDEMLQIREEVSFTKGRIIVRGKLVTRGKAKRADYILYFKPNIPLALIEAKDNSHSVGDGIQQGLDYAATLDIPFVFSSNGDGFVFHDPRTARASRIKPPCGEIAMCPLVGRMGSIK
jgi:type I restriction enzyme, R subunit